MVATQGFNTTAQIQDAQIKGNTTEQIMVATAGFNSSDDMVIALNAETDNITSYIRDNNATITAEIDAISISDTYNSAANSSAEMYYAVSALVNYSILLSNNSLNAYWLANNNTIGSLITRQDVNLTAWVLAQGYSTGTGSGNTTEDIMVATQGFNTTAQIQDAQIKGNTTEQIMVATAGFNETVDFPLSTLDNDLNFIANETQAKLTGINFTNDGKYIESNTTCVMIAGATSALYIC
jgi:hypothetical protein